MTRTWFTHAVAVTLALFTTVVFGFWALVAARLLTDGGNHISVDPNDFFPVLGVGLILGAAAFWAERRTLAALTLTMCLLCAVGLQALDHFNVLVSYDVWLARGMPERGEVSGRLTAP